MKRTASNSVAVSIAGIGMAALLVGCSSAGSSTTSSAPATSGATSAGAVASGSPAGGSGGGSTPAGGTTPGQGGPSGSTSAPAAQGSNGGPAILPCPTSGLKVTTGTAGAAAGSLYQQIDFTNTSGRTCTLYGYPGVALTTGTAPGSQVGAAATRSNAKPKSVITLASGKTASATLQITQVANYPTANCAPEDSRYLQVYPPGQTAAVYLPYQSKGCTKPVFVLGVTSVVAGA